MAVGIWDVTLSFFAFTEGCLCYTVKQRDKYCHQAPRTLFFSCYSTFVLIESVYNVLLVFCFGFNISPGEKSVFGADMLCSLQFSTKIIS